MKTKDLAYAYKVRHALDQHVVNLPASTTERLANARKVAMTHKKSDSGVRAIAPQLATAGGYSYSSHAHPAWGWLGRMGFVVPLAALVFGLMGIHQYEQHQQVLEAASIDAEVLTDELPLSAYLDHGFDAYLDKGAE